MQRQLNFIALITLGFVFMNVGMGKQAYELPQDSYSRLAEVRAFLKRKNE
jgi:hypothetical protein